jgi:REP element-mobilizing transposase RayT
MSNHLHLIAGCRDDYRLSDALRDFKKYTAKQIVEAIAANERESRKRWLMWLFKPEQEISFWQPDNHAKEISRVEFFRQKLEYIHQNPVRAGLVDREDAWTYSSARNFFGKTGLLELVDFN